MKLTHFFTNLNDIHVSETSLGLVATDKYNLWVLNTAPQELQHLLRKVDGPGRWKITPAGNKAEKWDDNAFDCESLVSKRQSYWAELYPTEQTAQHKGRTLTRYCDDPQIGERSDSFHDYLPYLGENYVYSIEDAARRPDRSTTTWVHDQNRRLVGLVMSVAPTAYGLAA